MTKFCFKEETQEKLTKTTCEMKRLNEKLTKQIWRM